MGEPDRPEHAEVLTEARARALVSGLVQGVFFRQTCARLAASAGLVGWVRNLPDGRVEAVFQGPRGAVEKLLAWCRTGPPGARVEDVSVSWEQAEPGIEGFRVGWA
ncbi:MAG: acylphosphatase [Actinomycetota bacterium]